MITKLTIFLLYYLVVNSWTTMQGEHICNREEKYIELERKNVTQPMKVRKNSWCLEKVRCYNYETQIKNIIKFENVTKTRITQECCSGFVEMIFENVTLCKSICEPGFMGDNCDFVCPNGYFGEMCDSKCNCQKESRCDSATGKCFDDLVDGLKYQKELENSIANHKNYKVVSPYMNIDFNKSDYAESFKLYKEMDQNQTMKVKLLEVLGYFDIEPMKENQYQTYLEKNKELKQKFDQVMDSNIHENSSNAMNKFEEKANQTEFDEMLSSIKSQATESHNIDFHEEDKAFLRFAGYVLIFMLVILALVFLYLKMLKLEERRNGSDAVSQSIFNMYEKPAKNFGKPLPSLPKLTLPQLVRQKSVFFEDIITEQRPLECRLEKLRTIPENYDVPHNNASITDLYSSSSKETKFPNAQTAPVHHTFPRRKSTISLNMEHIYDEINEKGGSRM